MPPLAVGNLSSSTVAVQSVRLSDVLRATSAPRTINYLYAALDTLKPELLDSI